MRARNEQRTFDIPADLDFEASTAAALLADFIRRETRKAGFSRAVLGLSGGVDSAATAALAVRALGAGNVVCALLPYRTSSPDSLSDARLMVRLLGTRSVRLAITPMIDAYFERQRRASALRRGNKMARERMAVLYDLSARERALHLGVPGHIVFKTATADLWPGQSDEQDIGAPYVEVDRLLHLLVDRRASPQEAIALG